MNFLLDVWLCLQPVAQSLDKNLFWCKFRFRGGDF